MLLFTFTAGTAALTAQILGARPLGAQSAVPPLVSQPVPWSPLPVAFSNKIVLWDNTEVRKLVMTFGPGAALQADFNRFTGWEPAPGPNCSAGWLQGSILLTLSALRPALAREVLEPDLWKGFVASLRDRRATILRVLSDDDSDANRQMLRLLGWRTRVYECEFTLPTAPDQVQRQIVAACSEGNTAYVFTLGGPAKQTLEYYHQEFERCLLNLRSAL